jgi:3-hydroxybutyryl-CoA dehydrogenase
VSERIVVVGGGSMGAGIAGVACDAGYAVWLVEPDESARERAASRAPGAHLVAQIPRDDGVALAIEAVPERLELKERVFSALAESLPNAVLATNTSSLSVAEIAGAVADPRRVVGLHFFNPPEKMRLVEIARATSTGDAAIDAARSFVERIGKTAILTADTPGFVVNRVARPFYLQSLRALDAGVADAAHLDALARGAGFRMGPFELMDFIGIDVNLATTQSVYERTREERLAPLPLQRALVAGGRLGRKSGSGFYSYDGTPPRIELRVQPAREATSQGRVVVLGPQGVADELAAAIERHYAPVARVYDDDAFEAQAAGATVAIDVGDGESDRTSAIQRFDAMLDARCALLVDAYATDVEACASELRHPERLAGYGVVGSLRNQHGVEVVAAQASRDVLELAREMFEAAGHGVVTVAGVAGLFLGRTIGGIVNEAVTVVEAGVATAEDVDLAMRLGTNYPRGPLEWGREIGGRRIARILERVAARDGDAFLPHGALRAL